MDRIICEFKSDTGNDGCISGYGSVFGNIDSYGDIVARGAFKKTIADANSGVVQWPAMLLQHGGMTAEDQTPIGVWVSMDEDDRGLMLTGKLAIKTERGRDAYELLKMKPRPALNGLSIGYRAKDFELHGKGSAARRTLKTIDLVKCSLVTFPANRLATITRVKSAIDAPPVKPYTVQDQVRDDWAMLSRTINANNRNWR
jgi:HK97 family phage prohead protease